MEAKYYKYGVEVTKEEYYSKRKEPNKELEKKIKKVGSLKIFLSKTDYKAIKYAEGEISEEEYAPIKELRSKAREEINALETEIKAIKEVSNE